MHGRRVFEVQENLRLRKGQGLRLEERQAVPRNSRIENIAPLDTVALGFSQRVTLKSATENDGFDGIGGGCGSR
jgi:hypothetical protein